MYKIKPRIETLDQPGSTPKNCIDRISILKKYISKGSVGAEIGVFKGSFIDYFLSLEPQKLYAVDPWYRYGPNWLWAKGNKSTVKALIDILNLFQDEIEKNLLEPCVEYANEFLLRQPDNSLDWVYIDTSHKYEQTIEELKLSIKKVKPVGYIMGDDYITKPDSPHYGVYLAVHEMIDLNKLKLIETAHNQFVAQAVL